MENDGWQIIYPGTVLLMGNRRICAGVLGNILFQSMSNNDQNISTDLWGQSSSDLARF